MGRLLHLNNPYYRNRHSFFTVFLASATSLLGLSLIIALSTGFLSSPQIKTDTGEILAAGEYRVVGRIYKDGVQQNGLVLTSNDGKIASWVNDGTGSYYYQIGRWIEGFVVSITLKNPYLDRACVWGFDNLPNEPGGELKGTGCTAKVIIGAGSYGTDWQNHLTWTLVAGSTREPTPTYGWPTEPPTPTYGWITRPPTPGGSTPTLPPFPTRTPTWTPVPSGTYPTATPYHRACISGTCARVAGSGESKCSTVGTSCDIVYATRTPTLYPVYNLLKNPGFELDANGNGKPDYWTDIKYFTVSKNTKHSGIYSGRIYSSENSSFLVSQTVNKIIPGKSYTYSGWINIPPTSDSFTELIQIRWFDINGNSLKTDEIARFAKATGNWMYFTGSRTAPVNTSFARVRVWSTNLNATVYIDDFSFR